MNNTRNIKFIRHGQTNGNLKSLFHGHTDEPLNDEGRKQATNIGKKLVNENIYKIYSSPLIRAHETAKIIAKYIEKPIVVIEEFKEVSFGKLEGFANPDPIKFLHRWIEGNLNTSYEVESLMNLQQRILRGLKTIFKQKEPFLIVSHGMIYFALCRMLSINFYDINNCGFRSHDFEVDLILNKNI